MDIVKGLMVRGPSPTIKGVPSWNHVFKDLPILCILNQFLPDELRHSQRGPTHCNSVWFFWQSHHHSNKGLFRPFPCQSAYGEDSAKAPDFVHTVGRGLKPLSWLMHESGDEANTASSSLYQFKIWLYIKNELPTMAVVISTIFPK